MKVGIVNVTGYAGSELARILDRHPEAEIASVTGRSAAGKRLPEVLPHLWQLDLPITRNVEGSVDVVFSTLPSGASAEVLAPMFFVGFFAGPLGTIIFVGRKLHYAGHINLFFVVVVTAAMIGARHFGYEVLGVLRAYMLANVSKYVLEFYFAWRTAQGVVLGVGRPGAEEFCSGVCPCFAE